MDNKSKQNMPHYEIIDDDSPVVKTEPETSRMTIKGNINNNSRNGMGNVNNIILPIDAPLSAGDRRPSLGPQHQNAFGYRNQSIQDSSNDGTASNVMINNTILAANININNINSIGNTINNATTNTNGGGERIVTWTKQEDAILEMALALYDEQPQMYARLTATLHGKTEEDIKKRQQQLLEDVVRILSGDSSTVDTQKSAPQAPITAPTPVSTPTAVPTSMSFPSALTQAPSQQMNSNPAHTQYLRISSRDQRQIQSTDLNAIMAELGNRTQMHGQMPLYMGAPGVPPTTPASNGPAQYPPQLTRQSSGGSLPVPGNNNPITQIALLQQLRNQHIQQNLPQVAPPDLITQNLPESQTQHQLFAQQQYQPQQQIQLNNWSSSLQQSIAQKVVDIKGPVSDQRTPTNSANFLSQQLYHQQQIQRQQQQLQSQLQSQQQTPLNQISHQQRIQQILMQQQLQLQLRQQQHQQLQLQQRIAVQGSTNTPAPNIPRTPTPTMPQQQLQQPQQVLQQQQPTTPMGALSQLQQYQQLLAHLQQQQQGSPATGLNLAELQQKIALEAFQQSKQLQQQSPPPISKQPQPPQPHHMGQQQQQHSMNNNDISTPVTSHPPFVSPPPTPPASAPNTVNTPPTPTQSTSAKDSKQTKPKQPANNRKRKAQTQNSKSGKKKADGQEDGDQEKVTSPEAPPATSKKKGGKANGGKTAAGSKAAQAAPTTPTSTPESPANVAPSPPLQSHAADTSTVITARASATTPVDGSAIATSALAPSSSALQNQQQNNTTASSSDNSFLPSFGLANGTSPPSFSGASGTNNNSFINMFGIINNNVDVVATMLGGDSNNANNGGLNFDPFGGSGLTGPSLGSLGLFDQFAGGSGSGSSSMRLPGHQESDSQQQPFQHSIFQHQPSNTGLTFPDAIGGTDVDSMLNFTDDDLLHNALLDENLDALGGGQL